jgi:hypothetical protein
MRAVLGRSKTGGQAGFGDQKVNKLKKRFDIISRGEQL